jgi:hypothetical protein
MCERKRIVTGSEGISIFGYMRGRLYQPQTTPEITHMLAACKLVSIDSRRAHHHGSRIILATGETSGLFRILS